MPHYIFSLSFAFPALFVAGIAGTAFAGEKEEGTFEFLRANPISAWQILVSKLCVAVLATLAMYVVLSALASLILSVGFLEEWSPEVYVKFWGVAALEALAWGTFFSLLTARPLLAVILGIAAASTEAHLLAWHFQAEESMFDSAGYIAAAPWRAFAALVVLGIDVVLGLRWLQDQSLLGGKSLRSGTVQGVLRVGWEGEESASAPIARGAIELGEIARPFLEKRDRSAMLARLFWQHWRQSGWLTLIMAGLYIGLEALLCFTQTKRAFLSETPGLIFACNFVSIDGELRISVGSAAAATAVFCGA